MDDYKLLSEDVRSLMDISVIEEKYDYSKDETWKELKKKSSKAYRELKKREFDIRKNG